MLLSICRVFLFLTKHNLAVPWNWGQAFPFKPLISRLFLSGNKASPKQSGLWGAGRGG